MNLYAHMWWDAPEPAEELDDWEPAPSDTDVLTVAGGCGCWSSLQTVDDDSNDPY